MKQLIFLLLLSLSVFGSIEGNDYTFPVQLITSAQNVTSVWTDVGSPVEVTGYARIVYDLDVDINDSSNVRLRLVRKTSSTDTVDRLFMIETVGTSDIKVEDTYYEFNDDADIQAVLDFNIIPVQYLQLQTQVSAEGSTKAQLDAVSYMLLKE